MLGRKEPSLVCYVVFSEGYQLAGTLALSPCPSAAAGSPVLSFASRTGWQIATRQHDIACSRTGLNCQVPDELGLTYLALTVELESSALQLLLCVGWNIVLNIKRAPRSKACNQPS
jgi:hypothetical protein